MIYELYHTTTLINATEINRNGFKVINPPKKPLVHQHKAKNKKKPGSLGYGLYAFEDDELAEDFKEKIIGESDIVPFQIDVETNKILDLSCISDLKRYNQYKRKLLKFPLYTMLTEVYGNYGEQSSLEGAIIEIYIAEVLVKKLKNNIQCVRGFTSTGVEHSAGSVVANGLEYVIKTKEIIK